MLSKTAQGRSTPFPRRLLAMIRREAIRNPLIVRWSADGRAFFVDDDDVFVTDILPVYGFKASKMQSFQVSSEYVRQNFYSYSIACFPAIFACFNFYRDDLNWSTFTKQSATLLLILSSINNSVFFCLSRHTNSATSTSTGSLDWPRGRMLRDTSTHNLGEIRKMINSNGLFVIRAVLQVNAPPRPKKRKHSMTAIQATIFRHRSTTIALNNKKKCIFLNTKEWLAVG